MVLTLNGDRILDAHIKKIRKIEKEDREKEDEEEEEEENIIEIGNRKIKRVGNEVFLNNLKNQEIRSLKRKKKELAQSYKEKINKNKTTTIKTKKNMVDEIKEDINDTTIQKEISQNLIKTII